MTTKNAYIGTTKGSNVYKTTLRDTGYTGSVVSGFNETAKLCHGVAVESGWWDTKDGNPLGRNSGELVALMHSELSEALEGVRKDTMDDHLTHRKTAEVELADCVIRILDYAEAAGYDIGTTIVEKLLYNADRADHKPENREKEGGKSF